MSDPVLDVLKLVLLALLYLFFARVLWAVWSEVRPPRQRAGAPAGRIAPDDPTASADRPRRDARQPKPVRGRGGKVARLVVLEPKERRGSAFPLGGELTIGREDSCTISMPGDTFVSTLHARVFEHEGQPMIEDLGSTNGTFHNGNRLRGSRLLHPGDRVQIGYTVLEAQ